MVNKQLFSAIFLVTGCCVGAGMIGLPVLSFVAGFLPTSVAMLICYAFTTLTGLLLLEATLWFDTQVNLPTIVEATLGRTGKFLTVGLFIFLFYCLFVAYLDGGGLLFKDLFQSLFNFSISREASIGLCLFFVVSLLVPGTSLVAQVNRFLLVGLIFSYLVLITVGLLHVEPSNLTKANLPATLATIPILLICFGFQNLVPSIVYYLKSNVKQLRIAIVVGNLFPFFIFLFWDLVILGILPSTFEKTSDANLVTELLKNTAQSESIIYFVKAFSFFALFTSFLPCAISFIDFLKDACKNSQKSNLFFYGAVFLPPLICTIYYPHIFLHALSFAGGFIDVLLFGLLPATVILIGRNVKKLSGPYQVIGGNITPIFIFVFSLIILFFKIY